MDENTNHPEKASLKGDFEDNMLDDSKARMLNGKEDLMNDTSVRIEDESSSEDSFAGLGKEELMKYANDPFWVRTRKILFIIFWLAWFAMLVAAIVIIVFAPKCPEKPDMKWYQSDIIYQIQPKSFKDTSSPDATDGKAGIGDINGIKEKVEYIGDTLGANAIWINSIYQSGGLYDGNDVTDHKKVDIVLGTMEDFDSLRKDTKKKGMKIMLDFIANHVGKGHEWFKKSEQNEENFADYFIWADGTGQDNSQPPNNWVTEYGEPAWTFSPDRGQWYYHSYLPEYPDLNLRNEAVLNELDGILKFWLDKGVDGFAVQGVQRLMEHNDTSETETTEGDLTVDNEGNFDLIKRWRAIIDSYSNKPGRERALVAAVKDNGNNTSMYHKAGLHVVLTDIIQSLNTETCDIFCLKDKLQPASTGRWRGWTLDSENSQRFGSTVSKKLQKAFHALQLLLPGTAVVYYGDEIAMANGVVDTQFAKDPLSKLISGAGRDPYRTPMLWESNVNAGFCPNGSTPWLPVNAGFSNASVQYYSAHGIGYTILKSFRDLALLRKKESFQFGNFEIQMKEKILYFTRKATGFPSHLVAINGGSNTAAFLGIADQLTLAYDSMDDSNVGSVFNTAEASIGFKGSEVFVFSY